VISREELKKWDIEEIAFIGGFMRRRSAGTASARHSDNRTMRPTTADTLVADKPEAIYYPEECGVLQDERGIGKEIEIINASTAVSDPTRGPS